jgi:LPS export ABC transporter protein LptC
VTPSSRRRHCPSKPIRLVLALLCCLGVGVWLSGCQPSAPSKTTPTRAPKTDVTAQTLSFKITHPHQGVWHVKADQGTLNQDQTEAQLTTVNGTIFDETGKTIGLFKAPRGHYWPNRQAIQLNDGVTLESKNQDGKPPVTLTARELDFHPKMEHIRVRDDVTIRWPAKAVLTGNQAEFTLDFQHLALQGATQTVLELP